MKTLDLQSENNQIVELCDDKLKQPQFTRLPKAIKKEMKRQRVMASRKLQYKLKKEKLKERRRQKILSMHSLCNSENAFSDFGSNKVICQPTLLSESQSQLDEVYNICIDLSYDSLHNDRERTSLARQLSACYGHYKRATIPISLNLCGVHSSSALFDSLSKQGFENWSVRKHQNPSWESFDKDKLVLLSPDAEETVHSIDSKKIYVIGGIVDRTVKKALTKDRAFEMGIECRRLPLKEYLPIKVNHILNVDHCFLIICKYLQTKNWNTAITEAVPIRKKISRDNKLNSSAAVDTVVDTVVDT